MKNFIDMLMWCTSYCSSGFTLPFLFRMPFKALSEHVKSIKKAKLKDAKMQEALNAYWHEKQKPEGLQKEAWTIAKEFGIVLGMGVIP